MAKKTKTQRIESLEWRLISMGLLLLKLRDAYGNDFGVGIAQQVNQAIHDYQQLERGRAQRAAQQGKRDST